ncbi:hypothetical protein VP1G_07461 [Cytospora mali]|uniref:Rhodopsin domain-containing protein n=1 Tax=Cytospora mali TaxID=578113 RepID=A0A194V8H6_CYTMA|nr:hypothetical protein VP1G_07461 [Valsa mali var. pyri (nom. inval.)]
MSNSSGDRGPEIVKTEVVLGVIDLLAVGFRFWSRRTSKAPLWWDDWFCLFLLFVTFPYNFFGGLLAYSGQGRHSAALPDHGEKDFRWAFGEILWYTFDLAMFKYGILLLYIRIFPQRWLRPFVITLVVLIAAWLITMEAVFIFQCKPVHASWDLEARPTAKCFNNIHVFIGQSVPTIVFDVIILSLPPILVWRVQIPAIDKTSVLATFLLCGLVTAASTVRLVIITSADPVDTTWNYTTLGLWSTSEPCLGLVCSCIPTYGVLVRAAKMKIQSIFGKRSGGTTDLSNTNDVSGDASKQKRKLSTPSFELLSQGTDMKGISAGDVDSLPSHPTDERSDGQRNEGPRRECFHYQVRNTQAEQQFV